MAEVVTSWEPEARRAPVTLEGQGTPVVSSWDEDQPKQPVAGRLSEGLRQAALNMTLGRAEAALQLGSGFAGSIAGGLSGLVTGDPANVEKVSQAMTYQPRTDSGQIMGAAAQYPFQKLAEGADVAGEAVRELNPTDPRMAGLATAVNTGIQMGVPALLGAVIPRGARAQAEPVKPVAEQLNEVRPIEEPAPTGQRFKAGPAPEAAPEPPPVVTEWTGAPSKESLLKAAGGEEMPGAGGPGTGTRAPEVVTEWKEPTSLEMASEEPPWLVPPEQRPAPVAAPKGAEPFDARLQDPAYRSGLERMAKESGWAEVGGKIIRADASDYKSPVVARTRWVPYAEWYQRMQQDAAARMPGGEAAVQKAIAKALNGDKLSAQERRTVGYMLDEHEAVLSGWYDAEADKFAPAEDPFAYNNALDEAGLEWTSENIVDLAKIDRARQLDPQSLEKIPAEADDAAYMRHVEEIINAREADQATAARGEGAGTSAFELTGETEAQAIARHHTENAALAAEHAKAGAAPPEDFTLTGSSRAADEARARGQQELPGSGTLNMGMNPEQVVEIARRTAREIKASPMGEKAAEFAGHIVDDLQMKLTPMAAGSASERARATAKEFANQDRLARYQWGQFDDILKKNYTPEQRKAMGKALDDQSVLEQTGQDTTGKGLDTLPPDQRAAIETINAHGRQLWERARAIGMVQGDGLPSYMPRMIVNIGEDGKVSRLPPRGAGTTGAFANPSGENIITTTPNLLKRKYLTPEETEAAAKEHFGEGATLVQDIRALPAALARFERAIAGRELIAKIKDAGTRSGRQLVSETEKPGFFTVDHPAFKTYRPRFVTDETGKTVQMVDQNGNPVFDKAPLYVNDEFKGPLKAIMSEKPGAIYNALMAVKGKTMSLIMYSPLIHNEVEFGRAFALMPLEMSKVGLAKGFIPAPKIYLDGNRLKNNPAVMREAIANGLVPIGKRFGFQDITGIAEEPQVAPGRSITAKAVGGAVGLVNKTAGEAVKRGIDTAGDFWHNTLLWDRVGDLQMGLYGKFLERAREKGIPEEQAKILAAHFANRYAGVLPNEATSAGFRKAANFIFFSRSFTGGNIGAMKDAFLGAPRDVVAQLRAAGADDAAVAQGSELARTFAQRKAIGALIKDVALAHLGVALVMSASEYYHDRDFDKILEGYRDRWNRLIETAAKDPWDASNPFADLRALSPSSENEAGKEDRVRVGTQEDGTAIYMRLPFGKIGEEMEGYVTKPLDMLRRKVGTIMRPLIEVYMNDKGFGRPVYNPDAKALTDMAKSVVSAVGHIVADQFPVDSATAAKDIVRDIQAGREPKGMDELKALGPLAGVTFSKGAPGGPAVGEMFDVEKRHRNEVLAIQADVRKMIANGEIQPAIEKMNEAHMTPQEIATTLKYSLNPGARIGKRRLGKFYQVAPDEDKERMQRLLETQ